MPPSASSDMPPTVSFERRQCGDGRRHSSSFFFGHLEQWSPLYDGNGHGVGPESHQSSLDLLEFGFVANEGHLEQHGIGLYRHQSSSCCQAHNRE